VHLAAAVNCPVFGVFNGTYYKRFAPYPKAISAHFFAIYPDEVDADLNNEKIPQNKFEFASDMPYSRVNAQKVIEVIKDNQYIFN
jgi:ADP-heptose:LPS heptosyltransferase